MNIAPMSSIPGLAAAQASLNAASATIAAASDPGAQAPVDGGAIAGAVVQQQAAVYAFHASLKTLEVQSSLIGTLVDTRA